MSTHSREVGDPGEKIISPSKNTQTNDLHMDKSSLPGAVKLLSAVYESIVTRLQSDVARLNRQVAQLKAENERLRSTVVQPLKGGGDDERVL